MAEELKDNWKQVGKDFTSFGSHLGKSIFRSVKKGVSAATKWAEEKEPEEAEAKAEEPQAEETKVEEPKAEEVKVEEPKAEASETEAPKAEE